LLSEPCPLVWMPTTMMSPAGIPSARTVIDPSDAVGPCAQHFPGKHEIPVRPDPGC
jgi:hypothetical protein